MTNTPKPIHHSKIRQLYHDLECDRRLAGIPDNVIYSEKRKPEQTSADGSVEYRFVERRHPNGSCVVQEDIYIYLDGNENRTVSDIEVDGQEYYAVYDNATPLG